ncbi:zinc ribbon domain-containing protein [Streptomyces sp. NPDC091265]|uniref:zinc ribbon domain-containing protein n=1 Tax=unclassified Streptomyces TaxID=2593676 RepID=UPI00344B7DD6
MPSYCPFCGTPAPDEARFCMKCGRERPQTPAAPPAPASPPPPATVPSAAAGPGSPPPPGHAPMPLAAPAGPSPLGAFLGRAFRGDWAGSVKAAAWPTGLIVALAVALSVPSYGQGDEVVVGWSDRLRIALAMLLQAFGGGFEVRAAGPGGGLGGSGDESGGSGFDGSGFDGSGSGGFDAGAQGGATLSLVPLTVTVLWVGALFLGARAARRQGGGLEAAVRISLVAAAAVLLLGLFAQPEVAGVSVESSPVLATLGALLIALLVTGGVLQRDAAAQWLSRRPAALSLVRATGTAVRALGAVLLLCSLIGFVSYANVDGVDGEALLIALPLLPNIGLMVLGVSWGAPVEYDVKGQFSYLGSGMEHGGFGLPELGEELSGWAVTGALVTGAVCALAVGLLAARRSADRREQATAGGLFLLFVLVLTAMSGLSAEFTGGVADVGGQGTAELAPSLSDALLFGLLWVGAAVFVAPHLLRLTGRAGAVGLAAGAPTGGAPGAVAPAYPATPAPYGPAPGPTAAPEPGLYDHAPGTVPGPTAPEPVTVPTPTYVSVPAPLPPAPGPHDVAAPAAAGRRRTVVVWSATLTAALLVGAGATAGVLVLTDKDADKAAVSEDNRPAPAGSSEAPAADPSPEPAGTGSPAPSDTGSPTASTAPTAPDGYSMVVDSAGFTFAVPSVWDRQGEKNHQITYAGSTGRAELKVGVIRNAPYTSYENFRTLEKTADANQKDYRRIQLAANTFQGLQGAIWEYTYEDRESGETIHAIDQSYIADDGTEYAVYTTERDAYWPDARKVFDTALSTWSLNDTD